MKNLILAQLITIHSRVADSYGQHPEAAHITFTNDKVIVVINGITRDMYSYSDFLSRFVG